MINDLCLAINSNRNSYIFVECFLTVTIMLIYAKIFPSTKMSRLLQNMNWKIFCMACHNSIQEFCCENRCGCWYHYWKKNMALTILHSCFSQKWPILVIRYHTRQKAYDLLLLFPEKQVTLNMTGPPWNIWMFCTTIEHKSSCKTFFLIYSTYCKNIINFFLGTLDMSGHFHQKWYCHCRNFKVYLHAKINSISIFFFEIL